MCASSRMYTRRPPPIGARPTFSRSSRMSSTELFEAASISTTSSEAPRMMARTAGSSGSKSARGPPGGVEGAGEELGHARLAGAPRAHEEVGVVDLVERDRVAQGAHDVLLADDLVEAARPVPTVERQHGGHPSRASGASSDGAGALASPPCDAWPRALPDALAAALVALVVHARLRRARLPQLRLVLRAGLGRRRPGGLDSGLRRARGPHAPPARHRGGRARLARSAPARRTRCSRSCSSGSGRSAWGSSGSAEALYAWPVGLLAAAARGHPSADPQLRHPGLRGPAGARPRRLGRGARGAAARRGAPVLVLLAAAGLLRPEVWLYAAAYWAWVAWPRGLGRARPARRPGRRRAGAVGAERPRGHGQPAVVAHGDVLAWPPSSSARPASGRCPASCPSGSARSCALPELVLAVIGCAAGLVWFRRAHAAAARPRRAQRPGLRRLRRRRPAAARALPVPRGLACSPCSPALAALGWTALGPEHPARGRWRAGGALGLVVLALFAPVQAGRLEVLRADIAARDEIQADLLALVRAPRAARVLEACGPLFVPNHRPVPSLAFWLDRPPGEILSAGLRRPTPERRLPRARERARARGSPSSTRATLAASTPACRTRTSPWPATARGCSGRGVARRDARRGRGRRTTPRTASLPRVTGETHRLGTSTPVARRAGRHRAIGSLRCERE